MVKNIEIKKMPQVEFAHTFEAPVYEMAFEETFKTIEVNYIYEGSLVLETDGKTYTANTGDVICLLCDKPLKVKAELYHSHHTIGFLCPWEFSKDSQSLLLPLITKRNDKTREIASMIDDFIYNLPIYENSPSKVAKYMLDILYKIDEIARGEQEKGAPDYSLLVVKAKKYILNHINEPVMQSDLAKHLGISTGYLCSVFKKHEGVTVMKYINTLKLKSIKRMMKKEKITLYEASKRYGYQDPNYVSLLYKKLFGRNITK